MDPQVTDHDRTYDVDGNNSAVEVDKQAGQAQTKPQTLRLTPQGIFLEQRRDSVCNQDTTGRIEVGRDVIEQDFLDELLRRLLVALRDLLKGGVDRGKDSEVRLGAVQYSDEVFVLIDQCRELGGVIALGDELVDCLVRLIMMPMVAVMTMIRPMMRRMFAAAKGIEGVVLGGSFAP